MSAPSPIRTAALALAVCLALGGCGKSLKPAAEEPAGAALTSAGASGLATKNTTRIGGSSPAVDAAAVARTAYPALTPESRPRAVVLVSEREWPAALAASVLAGGALKAPLLYSSGIVLPPASSQALEALRPSGAQALGGAQAIRVGDAAAPPELRLAQVEGREPAEVAVGVEQLVARLDKRQPRRVIVTAAEGPPEMTAPAAGLAAMSGAPILFVGRSSIPPATRNELARLGQTSIYVVGPATVVSNAVVSKLERFGPVQRMSGPDSVSNAIAVARFSDGSFGWDIHEPGHGLVFANAARPLDGPAAAALSASGDYGPLLLLDSASTIPAALLAYLRNIQAGIPPSGAVRGAYNHGWLIGDASAISPAVQAKLDSTLEISPQVKRTEPALQPEESSES